MSELDERNFQGQGEDEGEGQEQEQVVLSKSTYEELLAKIAEGAGASREAAVAAKEVAGRLKEEDLKRVEEERDKGINYDEIKTVKDLVDTVLGIVNEQIAAPIVKMVVEKSVADEVREVKGRHEDFDVYRDEVRDIAIANPRLTIEQAYHLAKVQNPQKDKKDEKDEKKTEGERKKDIGFTGERPSSTTRGAVKDTGPLTVRSAAEKAFKDVYSSVED